MELDSNPDQWYCRPSQELLLKVQMCVLRQLTEASFSQVYGKPQDSAQKDKSKPEARSASSLFFLKVKLLYNVVLVSAEQQRESAVCLVTEPVRLLCPWGFSRQEYWNALPGMPGILERLQGIFPTQGSNPALTHHRRFFTV